MNYFRFRSRLFRSMIRRHVPEGCILPWWALGVRTVLFPQEMLGHFLSRSNHYDVRTNTWLIHGVRYHDELFRRFAAPDEKGLYRFKRKGELVTIERVRIQEAGQ